MMKIPKTIAIFQDFRGKLSEHSWPIIIMYCEESPFDQQYSTQKAL